MLMLTFIKPTKLVHIVHAGILVIETANRETGVGVQWQESRCMIH